MHEDIAYAHRQSALTKLREYRLGDDVLIYQDDGREPVNIPYSSITKVAAEYAPSRVQPNRYFVHLFGPGKQIIEITNTHFVGFGDLEDRSESYVPFVTALHKKIVEHNPGATFGKASSWGGYIFSVIMVLFLLGIVAVAGFFFVLFGLFWVTLIKLLLIIFYFPSLIRYVKRNKPGDYDPLSLNVEVIPQIS